MKVARDYYRAGSHVYEISYSRGQKRTMLFFEETPRGDGRFQGAEGRYADNMSDPWARQLLEDAQRIEQ